MYYRYVYITKQREENLKYRECIETGDEGPKGMRTFLGCIWEESSTRADLNSCKETRGILNCNLNDGCYKV